MSNSLGTRNRGALIGLFAAAVLLTGCTSPAPGPSPTPAASAPPTATTGTPPTAEQIAWAGDVCTSTTTLKSDVQGLVTSVTAAGSGDVAATLSTELETVKKSAEGLASTIQDVPEGSEDDPERAAVTSSAETFQSSLDTLDSRVAAVEGTTGAELVPALQAVALAASESLVALGSTAQAITTAAADGRSTLGQAFAAAPECDTFTK